MTLRQIAGTNLPTPKGWITWWARAHVYVHNLLRVITRSNPAVRAGIEPRSIGPRPHSMPVNQPRRNRAVHYRPRIKSQNCRTARSVRTVLVSRIFSWTLNAVADKASSIFTLSSCCQLFKQNCIRLTRALSTSQSWVNSLYNCRCFEQRTV